MRKKSSAGRRTVSSKDLECRECQRWVENVDSDAASVLCWRCVSKSLNPQSIILSDMSGKELAAFLRGDKKK